MDCAEELKLYVGNLSPATLEPELIAGLRGVGEDVVGGMVAVSCKTGRSKRFGFVKFKSAVACQRALAAAAARPITLDGQVLDVRSAHREARKPSGLTESDKALVGKRVPCPYDSSHIVPFVRLRQHCLVCDARPVEAPWNQPGVNRAGLLRDATGMPTAADASATRDPALVGDTELEALRATLEDSTRQHLEPAVGLVADLAHVRLSYRPDVLGEL